MQGTDSKLLKIFRNEKAKLPEARPAFAGSTQARQTNSILEHRLKKVRETLITEPDGIRLHRKNYLK